MKIRDTGIQVVMSLQLARSIVQELYEVIVSLEMPVSKPERQRMGRSLDTIREGVSLLCKEAKARDKDEREQGRG